MISFGFIGCGNMGGTLALAVAKTVREGVAVADLSAEAAERIARESGAKVSSNAELAERAKYLVLGVKPQVLPFVLEEIEPILSARQDRFVVISMAAGVEIFTIAHTLGEVPIIRIMPNTPACIGEGMIVYAANEYVTEEEKETFVKAFSAAGEIEEIPERLIDAASAVHGCGPAYVYQFIEALADGGVRCGLPRALAMRLAARMVAGAADTVLKTGKHPGELKDAVCSPAGSTIEGVAVLEERAFRGAVTDAVTAAYQRTKELG